MRILHACLTDNLAGSERYCADLANRQASMGHEVHVAVARGSRIPALLAPGVVAHPVGRFLRRIALTRRIRALAPDMLHAHLSAACKAFGGMRVRPPAVATLHLRYKPHQHARLDGLIALTDRERARIEGYAGLTARIWNWIPDLPEPEARARDAVRAELGVAPRTFLVGFCGRLHASKNPAFLVRAFRAAGLDDAALAIAGEGPERAALEREAEGDPRVRLLGFRRDVERLYRAFDLFVLPSREEPFSLVLLEAMSAGLPIVATTTDGPSEFLPCPPATLVASDDDGALIAALRAARARGQAREVYDLSPFDPHARVADVIAFYEAVRARA